MGRGLKYKRHERNSQRTLLEIVKSNVMYTRPNGSAYDKFSGDVSVTRIELELSTAITAMSDIKRLHTTRLWSPRRQTAESQMATHPFGCRAQLNTWFNPMRHSKAALAVAPLYWRSLCRRMQLIRSELQTRYHRFTLVDPLPLFDLAMFDPQWKGQR